VTVLGNERERIAGELRDEQARVYKTLRSSVVDAGEKLLHNAGMADELDLAMGFAHIADDMGYVRPTLTSG
jgi:DNA mismatch repair ATPase MutS